jgi:hypothetical protein
MMTRAFNKLEQECDRLWEDLINHDDEHDIVIFITGEARLFNDECLVSTCAFLRDIYD